VSAVVSSCFVEMFCDVVVLVEADDFVGFPMSVARGRMMANISLLLFLLGGRYDF